MYYEMDSSSARAFVTSMHLKWSTIMKGIFDFKATPLIVALQGQNKATSSLLGIIGGSPPHGCMRSGLDKS